MATIRAYHDDPAFMNCILQVDYQTPRWQRTVRDVLRGSRGVRSFKMDKNGMIEVSGIVDPYHLIRKLGEAGRRAQVHWFQFGQCSDNLFLPNNTTYYNDHHHDYYDARNFPFRGGNYDCGQHHYCNYDLQSLGNYDRGHVCARPVPARRRMLYDDDQVVDCCCRVM